MNHSVVTGTNTACASLISLLFVLSAGDASAGSAEGCEAYLRGDFASAMHLFLPLAKKGDTESELAIGWLYDNGLGVAHDDTEAARWYRRAAEQGDARAQQYLGTMYASGEGVRKDLVSAEHWFRLAAESDSSGGQYGLGVMYRDGIVVARNPIEAYEWFTLAIQSGIGTPEADQAMLARTALASEMTSDQIVEATNAARIWKPSRKSNNGALCSN